MKRILITSIIIFFMLSGCAIAAEKAKPVVKAPAVTLSAETKVMIMEIDEQINQKLEALKGLGQAQYMASMNFLATKHEIERIKADITQLQNRAKLLMTPPKVKK